MREETMKKGGAGLRVVVAAAVVGTWLAGAGVANATLPMQKKAKELGITTVTNCQSCHVEKLPKKGAVTHNERGKWLIAEKEKRKAKEVDAAWLKDYVEKLPEAKMK
jgi:mono/diheme cytochrome c family protein